MWFCSLREGWCNGQVSEDNLFAYMDVRDFSAPPYWHFDFEQLHSYDWYVFGPDTDETEEDRDRYVIDRNVVAACGEH